MKDMTKEEREQAIDAYTESLNKQLKKAMNFDVSTKYDRFYSGTSVYTGATSTLTYTTKRPMTDSDLERLAEGRL